MPTPPTSGQVVIDGVPLLVEPNTYSKGRDPLYGQAPLRLGNPVNLSPVSTFSQSSFQGGMGQEHFKDEEMYYLGDADTRWGWAQCKFGLPHTSNDTFNAGVRGLFAIRSSSAGVKPGLYSASWDGKRVWLRNDLSGNGFVVWTAPTSTIRSLARSFSGGLYDLNIGMSNGDIYIMSTGGRSVKKQTNIGSSVTFLDTLAARGDIAGGQDGKLWKQPTGGNWTTFATADMPIYDGESWNQRMWVIGHDGINRSALYTTDTITFQDIFRWSHAFVAEHIVLHFGQLYILGYTYDEEFDKQIGQIWSYNGSSMRQVFEMPDDIFLTSPYNTQYFKGADTYKKWLAFGVAHKGVWFYDPENDSIEPGPTPFPVTDGASNYVSALVNYGGRLVVKMQGEKGIHGEASNNKRYFPSYLTTSEYDADLPGQLKTWVRVRVRLKEPLPAGTSVQVHYTTEHVETDTTVSPPWRHAASFTGGTDTTQSLDLTTPVTSESIRFKLTLNPSPFSGSSDNSTPKVRALEVDYMVTQDTKWSWQFRAYGAPGLEAPDGSAYTYSTAQELQDALEAPVRNSDKKWVTFVDRDGQSFKVQVIDIRFFPIEDATDITQGYVAAQFNLGEV